VYFAFFAIFSFMHHITYGQLKIVTGSSNKSNDCTCGLVNGVNIVFLKLFGDSVSSMCLW